MINIYLLDNLKKIELILIQEKQVHKHTKSLHLFCCYNFRATDWEKNILWNKRKKVERHMSCMFTMILHAYDDQMMTSW